MASLCKSENHNNIGVGKFCCWVERRYDGSSRSMTDECGRESENRLLILLSLKESKGPNG